MPKLAKLEVSNLDPHISQTLHALLPARFYPCLKGEHPDGVTGCHIVIIGAFEQDQLVGASVSSFISVIQIAEIHFISDQSFQELLAFTEQELRQFQPILFSYTYSSQEKEKEAVLKNSQWGIRPLTIQYFFDPLTFNPPWLYKDYPLPDGFRQFEWKELKPAEREKILFQQKQGALENKFSPFTEESLIEYNNSFGIRYQDDVVGWMITHRLNPNLIRYSNLYIQKQWQHLGMMMPLLCNAIKMQIKLKVKEGYLETNLLQADSTWLQFLENRLKPYATHIDLLHQAWKGK